MTLISFCRRLGCMIINNDPVYDNLYRSANAVFSQADTSLIPSIGPFNLILDTRVDTLGPGSSVVTVVTRVRTMITIETRDFISMLMTECGDTINDPSQHVARSALTVTQDIYCSWKHLLNTHFGQTLPVYLPFIVLFDHCYMEKLNVNTSTTFKDWKIVFLCMV